MEGVVAESRGGAGEEVNCHDMCSICVMCSFSRTRLQRHIRACMASRRYEYVMTKSYQPLKIYRPLQRDPRTEMRDFTGLMETTKDTHRKTLIVAGRVQQSKALRLFKPR